MPAPKGNTNAVKHGFYSKRFTRREKNRLAKGDDDLESEINALRIVADRIMQRLGENGLKPIEANETTAQLSENALKSINTLANVMLTISTLARSHQLIIGKYLPVETAIMDALAELNDEDGIG
jgi:uncharacterized protein YjcR